MTDAARTTLAARGALAFAAIAFACGLARLAAHAAVALGNPYGMDYGEGVVWQQLIRIIAGTGYTPLRASPAFVFEYPPIYHLVTAATAWGFGLDQLFAGRLVSLVSTVVSAVLAGALTWTAIGEEQDRPLRAAAGLITALSFVTLPLLLTSALLMQIDMLAMAFTLAGLLLAARAVDRPAMAIGAGLLFTLALYTRQTSLPAPVASFVVLLAIRPRSAWAMLATAVIASFAALGAIYRLEGDHFLVHILFYNLNRIAWDHAAKATLVLLANIVPIALGGAGLVIAWRRLGLPHWRALRSRTGETGLTATAIVLLVLLIKTAMLPMILKSGANDNYLIDWFSGITILIGLALVPVIRAAMAQPATPSPLLLILVGIGLPIHMLDPPILPDRSHLAADRAEMAGLVARIRASPKPVVSDDMVVVLRAGQPVVWEPAIIAELGSAGVYDQNALAARVRHGDFGFFVTHGDRGDLIYDQRFTPVITDAMDTAYPRRERIGALTLHFPRAR